MKLKKLNYYEKKDSSQHSWSLVDLSLHPELNLIVGRNAVGKSRSVQIINDLAIGISRGSDILRLINKKLECSFTWQDGKILDYMLEIKNTKIIKEEMRINNNKKIERFEGNTKIFSEINEKMIPISPPEDKLVLQSRRDSKDYPYIDLMEQWSNGVKTFHFSRIFWPRISGNMESLHFASEIFDELSDESKDLIINEINDIGYNVESLETVSLPEGTKEFSKLLLIKEKKLSERLNELNISNGMFRAISLIIIVNYFVERLSSGLIIVDDLGEGLDHDRSLKLAKLLFKKFVNTQIQFIATTNDRFLMNAVDLEYWNILYRDGVNVTAHNYKNNKETFDEFKSMGLNNFDIFATDFLKAKKI